MYQFPRRKLKVSRNQRTLGVHVHCTCTMHHNAPGHRKYSLNCISVSNFVLLAQSFPKVKELMHMHSARAQHVHYAPHHQMACTIELRSLNSISVPNLVSIAQSFLKPEDPSQINFSGPGVRTLHRTGTVTTKTYSLG